MTKINESNALRLDPDDMITIENSLEMAYQSFLHEIQSGDHSDQEIQNMKNIVLSLERTLGKVKNFLDSHDLEIISDNSNRLTKIPMIEKKEDEDEWQ